MSSFYNKPEYILTIAEEGNISRAAQRLFVSQSTLTMYLDRVEKEFGTALFDRTVRPITPTKAGVLYISTLRSVQRLEMDFRTNLRHIINPAEVLNIGIGPIRSKLYMPSLIAGIRETYPSISVNIPEQNDSQLPSGLLSGKYDVIFGCFSPLELLFAETVPVGTETIGLIAPDTWDFGSFDRETNSPQTPHEISVRDLAHLPIITPRPENRLYGSILNYLERHSIEPDSIIMTSSSMTAVSMVAQGLGYAFVEYPFLRTIREEDLRRLLYITPKEEQVVNLPVEACYSKNSIKQDIIKLAISIFQDIFYKD